MALDILLIEIVNVVLLKIAVHLVVIGQVCLKNSLLRKLSNYELVRD